MKEILFGMLGGFLSMLVVLAIHLVSATCRDMLDWWRMTKKG